MLQTGFKAVWRVCNLEFSSIRVVISKVFIQFVWRPLPSEMSLDTALPPPPPPSSFSLDPERAKFHRHVKCNFNVFISTAIIEGLWSEVMTSELGMRNVQVKKRRGSRMYVSGRSSENRKSNQASS